MRYARLLGFVVAVFAVAVLIAPHAAADPPMPLDGQVTDRASALSGSQLGDVQSAVDKLYNGRKIRLWVVYVEDFSQQDPVSWAKSTWRISNLGDFDALLAVATTRHEYAFVVSPSVKNVTSSQVEDLRRNQIEPALHHGDWAGAAVAAANGLNTSGSSGGKVSWVGFLIALAVIAAAVVALVLIIRWRRRRRRAAEFAAARRVDPTDPTALAAVPLDALDDLSKAMVVEVDNAVRTSENELAVAIEEFGQDRTQPFTQAITNAKVALTQAFTVRQQLDDAISETPAQRRELLTRVIVSAAQADRQLDAQTEAFEELRDLVINAPARLDTMTQQLVDITARIEPSQQKMTALHNEFDSAALTSIAGNITAAQQRLSFADQNITRARQLADHPVAGQQADLVDSLRAAESALGQARSLLDAVDSAGGDIRRAAATLPSAVDDLKSGIAQADSFLREGNVARSGELATARGAAAKAVDAAAATGSTDPLGAFTELTKADAELDRLLASIAEERQAAERLSRILDQAMFTAQSRVRAVSDYIDTRRGSIGPEARTRLSEAARQLQAAETVRSTNMTEAIAYANGASALAAQAQSLANNDVQTAQRMYARRYRSGGGGSNMGAVIGGIIIGNVLRGGSGGGWSSTSYGGSSGGDLMGGGGRF